MQPHALSIFGEMSRRALETDSINLGQGFPDTDGPLELKEEVVRCLTEGIGNQYPPAHGFPQLRQAICEHQARFYGLPLDPDTDAVVTTGASEAISASLLALVESGDEVVMCDPAFDVYRAAVDLAGATPVGVPMTTTDLRPDIEAIALAITPRTKVLLLNSPHNPSGVVFTREEMIALANLAITHNLVVISDEAYEHLWFDNHQHIPMATLPGMFERTITIGSGGKSFSFTGWKVGWATGPANLIHAVRTVRQHLSFVSGGPFQLAIAHGLRFPDTYFDDFRQDLTDKRDQLAVGLASAGFSVLPTEGTYFITTDISGLGFTDGLDFCQQLPELSRVVAIPHQVFYGDPRNGTNHVRWAFCKKPEVLAEATDRLQVLLQR